MTSEEIIEEKNDLAAYDLPESFGPRKKEVNKQELIEKTKRIGPTRPGPARPSKIQKVEESKDQKQGLISSKMNPSFDNLDESDEGLIGPPRPPNIGKPSTFVSEPSEKPDFVPNEDNPSRKQEEEGGRMQEEGEEAYIENGNFYQIPYSYQVELNEHERVISALALDPAGGRLLSGSYDYKVKFWDFAGMNQNFRSFRTIEPVESNQVCVYFRDKIESF